MTIVRLYFDFISPFAYLAAKTIRESIPEHTVEPVPVVFGVLLSRYGHLGPAEIPPKRAYMFKNAHRQAAALGVPLHLPPSHPFNPLLGLRVVGLPMAAEERWRTVDALFHAVWGGGPGIETDESVARVLDDAGLPGADLVARAKTPEAKDSLRKSTEAAVEAGAFGVPTFVADGELFWGMDAVPHLVRFLAGEDPVDPHEFKRWMELPSSIQRKR